MKIVAHSQFKDPKDDLQFFKNWVLALENQNGYQYEKVIIHSLLGKTQVYGFNLQNEVLETIVIFPGFRTTSLIWDLDKGLQKLAKRYRIFMIETNGQPNLSDGYSPAIKSLEYGHWANDLFNKLNIKKAYTVGASFGGLICMKHAITNPERVKATFLLNAGCLQPFSLTFSNLYYNLLPVIFPRKKNVSTFLDKVIFSKPNHKLSPQGEDLLNKYILFCLQQFNDKTEKPYFMKEQLRQVSVDTYLLQGRNDLLFPIQKSISNAKKYIRSIVDVKTFNNVGHGIETHDAAISFIDDCIKLRETDHN
ncbi:MAG: alpha/beta hydrolase [Putridiphycobacter sp.]|nr:alpha/beta hydrolase [Putridiphycobacter sp.]